ncbi:MAG: pyridoxamine 5'-phosphate oxidase family protein [Planctomycetota bacterium]
MALLNEIARKAWENRQGPCILTTVSPDGTPNSVYVTCVSQFGEDSVLVADNFFSKTRDNVKKGGIASLLYMSADGTAIQIKGRVEYQTQGSAFDDMKKWNGDRPGVGVAVVKIDSVFHGSKQLC